MCGRFTLDTTAFDLAQQFKVEVNQSISSRYNIAPSQSILIIKQNEKNQRFLDLVKWGLVPSWVKSLDTWKSNLINARVETVEEKPSFRDGFKKRPCLIPVSGFYEWSKGKQPYYFYQDKPLFAIAGIWETWSNLETEEQLLSCTILTSEAKSVIAEVHHRMPVIIPSEYYDLWLGELDGRKELIESLPEIELQMHQVSKTVNSPKNDRPDCIKPL
ncbi:MAG: SOS response-associated peptidase [Pleurocapsa minor HA4230-MV1]|jgi:putative SOS response-associated peptidase YedK|nr:SOS response-associated peptidase [Pleurocapsa minor HA4230-MV1]